MLNFWLAMILIPLVYFVLFGCAYAIINSYYPHFPNRNDSKAETP